MRESVMRVLRVVVVALAAWLAFRWLAPSGYGWTVLVGVGVVALGWVALRTVRIRRARAEDARQEGWAQALMSPPHRPAAVRELRAELAALDPKRSARVATRHARLSMVLAELLEADGDPEGALEALRAVEEGALTDAYAGVVRHARAVASLSAGDPVGARAALDEVPGPSGDRGVDLRVRLLRGLIAVDQGDADEALEIAELVQEDVGSDRDLEVEARVLKAVALDAKGDDEAARRALATLDDEILDVLAVLGLPRVKALVARILEERDED